MLAVEMLFYQQRIHGQFRIDGVCNARHRIIFRNILDAETAAKVQFGENKARFIPDSRHKADHHLSRALKGINLENLRTDMAVNSLEGDSRMGQSVADRVKRLAGFQREAELRINLPGADKIMGMGIASWFDSQQNRNHLVLRDRNGRNTLQLGQIINDDSPDIVLNRIGQLLDRLVVAMIEDFLDRESNRKRSIKLNLNITRDYSSSIKKTQKLEMDSYGFEKIFNVYTCLLYTSRCV